MTSIYSTSLQTRLGHSRPVAYASLFVCDIMGNWFPGKEQPGVIEGS